MSKKILVMLLGCFALTSAAGCMKTTFTPVFASIQLVPSDILKSKFIGETCGSNSVFGGDSGNTSLAVLLKQNKVNKITYVDYDVKASMFSATICMKVYGY